MAGAKTSWAKGTPADLVELRLQPGPPQRMGVQPGEAEVRGPRRVTKNWDETTSTQGPVILEGPCSVAQTKKPRHSRVCLL